jgi:hypothetical protein
MEIDELLEFARLQNKAEMADRQFAEFLTDEALADRGEAVTDLHIIGRAKNFLEMRCEENTSRLRPGTAVGLETTGVSLPATIIDIMESGRTFHFRVARRTADIPLGPWVAKEESVDLSAALQQCLRKLQPGAPGWTFLKILAGEDSMVRTEPGDEPRNSALLAQILAEAGQVFDSSQEEAATACMRLPNSMAVQGPPGTGKTLVLAMVAEALARLGRRVLVVAPTHQAVNNALSTIHGLFPARQLVKVGDKIRRESLSDGIECKLLRSALQEAPRLTSEMITGMTLLSALLNLALRTSGLAPNVLLIDEAGQLPLVQGICAGLIGAGSTLLFGDDAQMPPVFPSEVRNHPFAVSLFARLREVRPGSVSMLDTSYRLNDELCRIISESFYPDTERALRPSSDSGARKLSIGLPDKTGAKLFLKALQAGTSFVWAKTSNSECRQTNALEADFIADFVTACRIGGLEPSGIAVVTPFRRQAALIRRMLQSRLPQPAIIPIVDTVERVQGLTVEVVAISLCASDPEYASQIADFLFSPNRLNVALSRARTKAVMAAAPSAFEIVPSDYDGLKGQQMCLKVLGRAGMSLELKSEI